MSFPRCKIFLFNQKEREKVNYFKGFLFIVLSNVCHRNSTVCIKKMSTRIITAYNSANSYQCIIILISQETLCFCLSNDVFFVEIEKVEQYEIEKNRLGKTHYFFNEQLRH